MTSTTTTSPILRQEKAWDKARKLVQAWNRNDPQLGMTGIIRGIKILDEEHSVQVINREGEKLCGAHRLEDGTIELALDTLAVPESMEMPRALRPGHAREAIHRALVNLITDEITRDASRPKKNALLCKADREDLETEIRSWALREAEIEVSRNSIVRTLEEKLAAGINRLADPDTMKRLSDIVLNPGNRQGNSPGGNPGGNPGIMHRPTIWHYNTAQRLGPGFEQLVRTNPGAITWVFRTRSAGPRINHPGQLITLTKEEMEHVGLEAASWRAFATLPPEAVIPLTNVHRTRHAVRAINLIARSGAVPSPQAVSAALEILEDLHVRGLGYERNLTDQIQSAHLAGNTERAIILMFRESARTTWDQTELAGQAMDAMDYIDAISREQQSIRARTWAGLLRRSRRWHEEETARIILAQSQEGEHRPPWESLLDGLQVGEIAAQALTNEAQLNAEAARMRHCVSGYANACRQGDCRIFTLSRRGHPCATMELRREGMAWRERQVRGRRNSPAGKDFQRAAREVALAYTQAWQEQRERLKAKTTTQQAGETQ